MVTHICIGAILMKVDILKRETTQCSHAWLQTFCMKAILTKMTSLMRDTNHDWLHNFAWDDLTKITIIKKEKLIIHGYIFVQM